MSERSFGPKTLEATVRALGRVHESEVADVVDRAAASVAVVGEALRGGNVGEALRADKDFPTSDELRQLAGRLKAAMESLDGARHSLLAMADDEEFDAYEFDSTRRDDEAPAEEVEAIRERCGAEHFDFALRALGTSTLRTLQATVIRDILDDRDGVLTAPTGCGKSGMFQIPAIALHRAKKFVNRLLPRQLRYMRRVICNYGVLQSCHRTFDKHHYTRITPSIHSLRAPRGRVTGGNVSMGEMEYHQLRASGLRHK